MLISSFGLNKYNFSCLISTYENKTNYLAKAMLQIGSINCLKKERVLFVLLRVLIFLFNGLFFNAYHCKFLHIISKGMARYLFNFYSGLNSKYRYRQRMVEAVHSNM